MDNLSQLLKDFYKHFAGIGIYIIPGIIVLEVVFNIGFFGQKIEGLYEFILFLFWGLVLGGPFHYTQPKQFAEIVEKFKKKKEINKEGFWDALSDELELGFIAIKTIAFFIIYKFILWQDCLKFDTWFNIDYVIANYMIAMLLTMLSGLLLIYPYKWFLEKRYLDN